jgi:hypothetical protein
MAKKATKTTETLYTEPEEKSEEKPATVAARLPDTTAEATTTEGAGKGRKRCESCGAYVGVRTRICPCGAEFPPPAAKGEPRTRSASTGSTASPTLDMVMLAKLRAEETGTVAELLAEVESLLSLSEEFGGLSNLHKCLTFLISMGAK